MASSILYWGCLSNFTGGNIMELVKYNSQYDSLINNYYLPDEQLYYSGMTANAAAIS